MAVLKIRSSWNEPTYNSLAEAFAAPKTSKQVATDAASKAIKGLFVREIAFDEWKRRCEFLLTENNRLDLFLNQGEVDWNIVSSDHLTFQELSHARYEVEMYGTPSSPYPFHWVPRDILSPCLNKEVVYIHAATSFVAVGVRGYEIDFHANQVLDRDQWIMMVYEE